MTRPIILVDDTTSGDGVVIESSATTWHKGRKVARVGDIVRCPHGVCAIVTGDETTIIDGAAVAREGDLTDCGDRLVVSQRETVAL